MSSVRSIAEEGSNITEKALSMVFMMQAAVGTGDITFTFGENAITAYIIHLEDALQRVQKSFENILDMEASRRTEGRVA